MKKHFIAVITFLALSLQSFAGTAFLEQSKEVLPMQEWNREISSSTGGKIEIKIESQSSVSVLLIADRTFQAIKKRDQNGIHKSDIVLNIPSSPCPLKEELVLPAGTFWFMIQNLGDTKETIGLTCYKND